jgi:hypothetical protein
MTTSVVVLAYFYILTRLPTLSTRSIACRAIIARMIPVTLTPTVFTGIQRFCTTSRSGTFPRPGSTVFKTISLLCRGALAASRGGPPLRADRLYYATAGDHSMLGSVCVLRASFVLGVSHISVFTGTAAGSRFIPCNPDLRIEHRRSSFLSRYLGDPPTNPSVRAFLRSCLLSECWSQYQLEYSLLH